MVFSDESRLERLRSSGDPPYARPSGGSIVKTWGVRARLLTADACWIGPVPWDGAAEIEVTTMSPPDLSVTIVADRDRGPEDTRSERVGGLCHLPVTAEGGSQPATGR